MNKNNLNRIKGILSAKNGTQVPKFQGGFVIYHTSTNQPLYSKDGTSWFTDENYMSPFTGSLNNFTEPELGQQFYTKNSNITIPEQNQITERENIPIINTLKPRSVSLSTTITPNITTRDSEPVNKAAMEASAGIQLSEEDQKLSDQMMQRKANISQGISTGIQSIGNTFGASQQATDSELTKNITTGYNAVADVASNFGPMGQLIGGAMKTLGAIGNISQAMGGGTDQQTKLDSWMDSPLLSWNVGAINGFFGKNTNSFGIDQETMQQVGSSYGGTATSINEAAESADKEYGLFSYKSRKKANSAINKARQQQNLMGNIADQASDQRLAVQSMGEQAGLAYSMMTDGGYNQKYTYAAKQGGVLEWEPEIKLEWEPLIELNWELPTFKDGGNIDIVEELEWIPEFKSGGKTEKFDIPEIEETNQKNVIPEGALHKNKHHMEHAEGLTKKGIPVIDEEGEQQAEIEHSEIIFTLEVTKKLEEYYQIFYSEKSTNKEKEQAALDAGKLLVYQILENTEDRTGLIESCKKGGTLTLKKSTDDLIEEILEWVPNITIVEEIVEEKPKKESKKSEKEQMKEAIKEVLIEILTK